jgi:hypothetical protein
MKHDTNVLRNVNKVIRCDARSRDSSPLTRAIAIS